MKNLLYSAVLFAFCVQPYSYGKELGNHPIIALWSTTNCPVVLIKLVDAIGENRTLAENVAIIYVGIVETCAGCALPENTVIIYASPEKIDIGQRPRIIMGGNLQKMLKPMQGNNSVRFFVDAEGGYTVKETPLMEYRGTLSTNLQHIKSFIQSQGGLP